MDAQWPPAASISQQAPRAAWGGNQISVDKPSPFSKAFDTRQLVQDSLICHRMPAWSSTFHPHDSPLSWVLVSLSSLTDEKTEVRESGDWPEITKLGSG